MGDFFSLWFNNQFYGKEQNQIFQAAGKFYWIELNEKQVFIKQKNQAIPF